MYSFQFKTTITSNFILSHAKPLNENVLAINSIVICIVLKSMSQIFRFIIKFYKL